MSMNISRVLNSSPAASKGAAAIFEYEEGFRAAGNGALDKKGSASRSISDPYYDPVTDFYEFGWGQSFHFAPREPDMSFRESLARHERFLAETLELRPGMVVADIGCGIGGPLMEIALFSGAHIVGVNSNAYQLERARNLVEESGLNHLAAFLHGDFTQVEAPDESFDAVYSIEATCHAPDKHGVYGEIFRLLKPGASFANYEYCMTDRFDPGGPLHLRIKADIQSGGGLLETVDYPTVDEALRSVGFEVLEARDLALRTGPSTP